MPVRAMRESDLDAVVAIASECFEPPWTRENFAAELERSFALCRVAEESGEIVAYVIAWLLAGELEVLSVATRPTRRRAGHAKELVRGIVEHARTSGAARGFLEVRADNVAAIALYASLGFRPESRRARYYADGADAIVMAWAT